MQIVVLSGAVQKIQGDGTLGRFRGMRLACHHFVQVRRRRFCLSQDYWKAHQGGGPTIQRTVC
jgi:hypothetical protein